MRVLQQRLQQRIVVARPISACFAYLQDFSTIEQWDPGVYRAEKLTPGAPRSGSDFRLTLQLPAGRHLIMHYRLETVEPLKQLVLRGWGDGIRAHDTLIFEPIDQDTTAITYCAQLELPGLSSLIRPLIKPILERVGRKAAQGLANALSTPQTPPVSHWRDRLADQLILPALRNFGHRGYRHMPRKAHAHRLDDKTVVITGATAGLGLAAAGELSRLGARLVLIGRHRQRLLAAKSQIQDFSGSAAATIDIVEADLAELQQTASAAQTVLQHHPKIDVLINNAGILCNEHQQNSAGIEVNLAVNFLSPLLLCQQLTPALTETSRVINVVSAGQYLQGLNLNDMQFKQRPFSGPKAYAAAKRALLTLTTTLADTAPFNVQAMHPGWAATPGVARALPAFNTRLQDRLRDARMGADTMVWLAAAPEVTQAAPGQLWFDRRPHVHNVLPWTRVSPQQQQQLQQWVQALLQDYTEQNRCPEKHPVTSEAS